MQVTTFTLAEQVQHAVIHHPHLKQRRVHFKADNGRVVLNGSVKSYFEKQMAQEAVRNIDGVKEIQNELTVDWA
jgi:osmotically-inducible protein OsmY